MKAQNESAWWKCLLLAGALTLASCASFGKPAMTLTPRSESVCDQAPPAPLPPIPDTQPDIFAAMRQIIGLYRDEVIKDQSERACREKVREENRRAAGQK